ncbi:MULTISPECIES: nucleotide-binding protein [Pseudonocardia]|uniref:CobQ/CobB/MinD/ParA nucleotide binding domain protein n=2 Tax=Pseudonocardia TaxID=1847 RepID=A0A1Y2N7J3_PSEAH|nr:MULTISPECIES: hypothetical protein [Pseudonocardia]OSY43432.1 CobQ/CobB/MinD/ParA nucleotide binding domain protein [Pseudonocardia autotrophica]TDN73572.1 MinD-like ATPase involved in chromosome partitioning or flagellar assembly [Pseudonocardia autotrophica]BBG04317.1 hypothetical protein Pdca_55260 [Pseudonocardia autotrophica]
METRRRNCALPGCGETIEQFADRPVRLYCGAEHRRAARRIRAEHSLAPEPERRTPEQRVPAPDRTSAEINHDALIRPVARRGRPGGAARTGSGRPDLLQRIRSPLAGPTRVAVFSLKGGVGKTTVAAGLGLTLAELRGDRIAVADVAPDPGTLAERLAPPPPGGGRFRLAARERIETLGELLDYAALAGRLTVLGAAPGSEPPCSEFAGSEPPGGESPGGDSADSVSLDGESAGNGSPGSGSPWNEPPGFGAEHFAGVDRHLTRFSDVTIADCGPGLRHSAVRAAVRAADVLIVVGAFAVDDASRAAATLSWLGATGARNALVVLTGDRHTPEVPADRIRAYFRGRARALVELPFDPHLRSGGPIDPDRLREESRERFLELAALVVDGLPSPRRAVDRPTACGVP